MRLNINSDAAVALTNKLEKMHRSELPIAVRGTLNSAAFDVKTNTMPREATKAFIERKKTFFKAKSKFTKASGFNLPTMKAVVGFVGNQQAVEDLEEQERGGKIGGRAFIPIAKTARISGSIKRPVRKRARISEIGNVVDSKKVRGVKSQKQQFIKAALIAGAGGHVIGNINRNNRILYRINKVIKIGGGVVIGKTPIHSYKKGRTVTVKATHFMRKASLNSAKKLDRFFQKEAERRFKRA